MILRLTFVIAIGIFLGSCATKVLKYDKDKTEQLEKNTEFENAVKIEIPEEVPEPVSQESLNAATGTSVTPTTQAQAMSKDKKKSAKDKAKDKRKSAKDTAADAAKALVHEPDLESSVGFEGRRPVKDPFRVGEKVVHEVTYLKMSAGLLTLEVKPFATVNGRKSYNFYTGIKTKGFFSSFYAVDDFVTTLVDYDLFVPSVFKMSVKESGQIKQAQALFDWNTKTAKYWEKKVTEKDGETEKKQEWEILEYSQNVFSIAFYMRVFQWQVGDVHSFRVAEDGENLVFKGTAVRKQRISTAAGEFDTIAVRPDMLLKGQFKPSGENLIFMTDDDRKMIVRIESKIKIGTLVSEVVEIYPGR